MLPDQNAVIAITSGAMEMQTVLDYVWEHLLPGMSDTPLNEDPEVQENLEKKLSALAYPSPVTMRTSSETYRWHEKCYEVGSNEAGITHIRFHFTDNEFIFSFQDQTETQTLEIGNEVWLENQLKIAGDQMKVKAAGTWRKKNVLELSLRFIETAYCDTWTFHFVNDSVKVSAARNVWIIPGLSDSAFLPTLIGFQYRDRDMWVGNGGGQQ
ncbi:hypothetical protein [Paenibacillus prosopidis]|uniref:hypothetical protein n=1 Tax=Paenibacillus prosopidis TaxID=630520 RepID=UPI000DF1F0C4|nr:hypothetical protein [Paenibacillus prosopidis]